MDLRFRAPVDIVVRVSAPGGGDLGCLIDGLAADMLPAGSTHEPPRAHVSLESATAQRATVSRSRAEFVPTPHGVIVVRPDRTLVSARTDVIDASGARDLLTTAITVALTRLGIAFLHGTAFRLGAAAPIAVGASGAGKSTLTAAALGCGARIVSDDSLLASVHGGEVHVSAFRNHLSFRSPPAHLLPPALRPALERVRNGSLSTWRLDTCDLPANFHARSVTPDRLWVLSVDRRLKRSRITPLDRGQGLAALIPASSPLMLSPRYRRERSAIMTVLSHLVDSCTPHRVRLGLDLLDDPESALDTLLSM